MKLALLLALVLPLAGGAADCRDILRAVESINVEAASLAIEDLAAGPGTFDAAQHRAALVAFATRRDALVAALGKNEAGVAAEAERLVAGVRAALLANPLLDFDAVLVVQRDPKRLGLPANWEGNSSLPPRGYANSLAVLSGLHSNAVVRTLYQPPQTEFVGDVDLDFDAARLLFSMPAANGRWQVWEMQTDGSGLKQLPLIPDADVDNYGGCFLPDGNVIFSSSATFAGVPCVRGSAHVANLFRWEREPGTIRRLTFDQDHNWCPNVLGDGRLLYLRWEYADLPHFVSRILFTMNPDGTEQREFYGSNSYWPNSTFYARPAPGSPSKFFGVVSGHHDTHRMGELVLFDSARGRHEAEGAVQRLPGRGKKVEAVIRDRLVADSWPKFLHPWPLSEKYVLVAAQPSAKDGWGIYLADVFDNLTLIKDVPGTALLEPIPLKARARPPVIPSKVKAGATDALVHIADIYNGPGLRGVPPGTVKQLRLFTYQYAYQGMGGQIDRVGLDGPWDVKRILGTVPVAPDGSANFRVPANLPLALQPLDADGRALQLMRSWMTAMPGEVISCAGCHERQNTAPPPRTPLALAQPPAEITPWPGGARGFAFTNEVQPVLDRYCIGCHGSAALATGDGCSSRPDLRGGSFAHAGGKAKGYDAPNLFPTSYLALKRFVRNPTIESDMHLLMPGEYHADTTALVQLLEAGHHGVQLNCEAWDRLNTWIDLNAPARGSWTEICGTNRVAKQCARRSALLRTYAGRDEDPETVPPSVAFQGLAQEPAPLDATPSAYTPSYAATAPAPAAVAPAQLPSRKVDLGDGVALELVQAPAGAIVMGDNAGPAAERPAGRVQLAKPFWIGRCEISNAQFAKFDPAHDSRIENGDFLQFSERERGYPVNSSNQPVVRISWHEAQAFCRWLSQKTGQRVALPTEAQWEYACRAGTTTPLNYGACNADFAKSANLADASFWCVDTFGWGLPSGAIPPWRPAYTNVHDGHNVSAPIGSYAPNAWGLHDLHGNAAEWTRSLFRPYPWREDDGRNNDAGEEKRVVRGGAWSDRPEQARSSSRRAYPPWRGVFNVGFRIVIEE
jgi:formylglycine-generating enzyme required for sulfatase activity